ncbi:YbhB/YbcL family Raf kinase inhibitor-like protein [Halodesulfovibrio marinisediminis]|uniref:Phospholipid-binding protein, PBP family n=1 Tax=Halodesulfovibrio marinisediminis DSM 17456 TaxID=1121457 RepID=A0A1N6F934_9BACT|nr:YbhB/YbcL family Raf kinase inhibitor-like protein [Halodesulfovibrio marinisediminis]SIN91818.1 phospholipid-binding protein, PBP family [Halodesulfovibrio marinisediminis DSM 17456]
MKFFSPAFANTDKIPAKYTCDGEDISPPLEWSDIPVGTQSLAIICDDPDAPVGVWDHWLIFNINPNLTGLDENTPKQFDPFKGVGHGLNSWKNAYYGGPCPPSGQHRYYFKLYALDRRLQIKPGSSKGDLLRAMEGHILEKAHFYGVYAR